MVERSLTDRVLGMWEEGWHYTALKTLAEATEANQQAAKDTQRRLDDLEEVVPPPPRWPTQQVRVIPPSQGGS